MKHIHNPFCSEQRKQEAQNILQNQTQQLVGQDKDVKPNSSELLEGVLGSTQGMQIKEEKSKFGFPQNLSYNVADYRSLVKTLVCGVKTITWGCSACKVRKYKNFD